MRQNDPVRSIHLEIDAIVAAFYAAFDNRLTAPDGLALRAVFAAGATITRADADGVTTWDADAFIAPRVAMLGDGTLKEFHEWEVDAQTTVLEKIASRWSCYAKAGIMNGAPYRGGGQKFIQLCRSGGEWKIASVLWQDDAETN